MPDITIQFNNDLNESLQIGDTAYYINIYDTNTGGFDTDINSNVTQIGVVTSITPFNGTNATIVCDIPTSTTPPTAGSFIFFSKTNLVNGKLKGYFAKARMQTSNLLGQDGELDHAPLDELYSVSVDTYVSSK